LPKDEGFEVSRHLVQEESENLIIVTQKFTNLKDCVAGSNTPAYFGASTSSIMTLSMKGLFEIPSKRALCDQGSML
jgi:hypothetical protein